MKFPCDFCRFVWTSISVLWITCQEPENNWPLPLPWVIGHSLGMGSSSSFHLRKMWKAWLFRTRSGSQRRRCLMGHFWLSSDSFMNWKQKMGKEGRAGKGGTCPEFLWLRKCVLTLWLRVSFCLLFLLPCSMAQREWKALYLDVWTFSSVSMPPGSNTLNSTKRKWKLRGLV